MNVTLWIASGLLATVYLAVGTMKVVTSRERLARNPNMAALAEAYSARAITSIGVVEVAGALGLVLPWATGIVPILTPAAAGGLAVLQVGAGAFHGRRREYRQLPINGVFLALALFVAAGRIAQLST